MRLHLDQPLAQWLPVPSDLPFTRREALANGLTDRHLRRLVEHGQLRRPLRGVFVDARLPDTLDLRVATLAKVMPEGCFVADRTAGWLHGANMILAPNDHLAVPNVSLFHLPGNRCRRDLASSGERDVVARDLVEVGGLLATSPLRTALDLGRLLPRAQALAALDSLLGLDVFTNNQLLGEVERFAKQRGVRQLRFLAPLADGLAASPGESGLRLLWYDGGLPKPRLQIPYVEDGREIFYLDMGLEEIRFAAEYDGEEWHSASDAAHDRHRRTRMREQAGWQIEEFRREDVFGHRKDADWALRSAVAEARQSFDRRTRHL